MLEGFKLFFCLDCSNIQVTSYIRRLSAIRVTQKRWKIARGCIQFSLHFEVQHIFWDLSLTQLTCELNAAHACFTMEIVDGKLQKLSVSLIIGLGCLFLYHAWYLKNPNTISLVQDMNEDIDFANYFNISNHTIQLWGQVNKDLRPLEKEKYEYRLNRMKHCNCDRMIKVLKSENTSKVSFNDTTCSEEAFSRGFGQKVRLMYHIT